MTEVTPSPAFMAAISKASQVAQPSTNESTSAETNQTVQQEVVASVDGTTQAETTTTETTTTQTETPVTATTETKETKVTETPVQDENKWWLELDKSETKQTSVTETPAQTTTSTYDPIFDTPEMQMVAKLAKETGKNPVEILKDLVPVDYSKMDGPALLKEFGKIKGLTPEQIDAEIESLQGKGLLDQQVAEDNIRNWLATRQKGVFDQYVESGKQRQVEAQKREQAILEKAQAEITQVRNGMIGKDFFGLKMTEDDAKDFEEFVGSFTIQREDGTFNIPNMLTFWLGARKLSKIQRVVQSNAEAKATEAVLKDVSRVNEDSSAPTRIPNQEPAPKDPKKVAQGIADLMYRRMAT